MPGPQIIEICVFPQEGLLNDPGCEELLIAACRDGADLIGGCPYVDSDPHGHIARIFAIAQEFDLDIDFHLDFDLDPSWMHLDEVLRQTERTGWGGRVAVGHATKLSAIDTQALAAIARRLAEVGVAVTVIPATDLFLMGRDHDHNVPRGVTPAHRLVAHGVTCSLATNNVLNPFTPFGDCSLIRMANLYANVAQVGHTAEIAALLDLVTTAPAKLMNLPDYGIAIGNPADIVVLDCSNEVAADCRAGVAIARIQARAHDVRAVCSRDQLAKGLIRRLVLLQTSCDPRLKYSKNARACRC